MATKKETNPDANANKRFVATKYDTGKGKMSRAGRNAMNKAFKDAGIGKKK